MTSKGRTSLRRKARREFNLGDNSTHDAAFEQNMRSPKIVVNASMQLHSPVITPSRRRGHLDSSSLSEGKFCSQVTPSKWTSLLPDYSSSQAGESPTEVTWDCASPEALQYLRRRKHGDSSKLKDILQVFSNDGPKHEEKRTSLQLNVLRASIQHQAGQLCHPSSRTAHRQRKVRRKQRPVSNKAVELCGQLMTALQDTQPTDIHREEPGCDVVEAEETEQDHAAAADSKDSLPSGGCGGLDVDNEVRQSCEDACLPSAGADGLDADNEDSWDDNDLFENSSFIIKATQICTDTLDSSATPRRRSSRLPLSSPDEAPSACCYGSNDQHNSGIVPPTLVPKEHSWEKFKVLACAQYTAVESTAKPGQKGSGLQNSNSVLTRQAVLDSAKMSVTVSTAAETDATKKRHFASPRILFTDDATTSSKSVQSIVMKTKHNSVKNSKSKDATATDAKRATRGTDNNGNILPANPGLSSPSVRRKIDAVGSGRAQAKVFKDLSSYGLSEDLMAMLADPDDEFDSQVIDQFPTQAPPKLSAPSTLAANPATKSCLKDSYGNSRSRKPEPRQGAGNSNKCNSEEFQKALTKSVKTLGSNTFHSKSDTAVSANRCQELLDDLDPDILASICEYDSFSESPKCVKRQDKPVYVPVHESSKSDQMEQHNGCWVRKLSVAPVSVAPLSVAPVSVAPVSVAKVAEKRAPDGATLLHRGEGPNEQYPWTFTSAAECAGVAAGAVPDFAQAVKGPQAAAPHKVVLEPSLSKNHKFLLQPAPPQNHSDQPGSRAKNQALGRRNFSFKPRSQLPSSQAAKCLSKSVSETVVGGPCVVVPSVAGLVTSASASNVAGLTAQPDFSQTLDSPEGDMSDDALYESQIIALLDEAESQATQFLASQVVGQDSLTAPQAASHSPPHICSQDEIELKRQAAIERRHLRNKPK